MGPVSPENLRELAASGRLRASDLVWKQGLETWVPAARVKGLFPTGATEAGLGSSQRRARPVRVLGGGVWIVEGLDLSRVSGGKYDMACLPLKLENADGSPARAVLRPVR